MFKYLVRGLLAGITIKLLDNWRHLSLHLLKIEAAKCYVHGMQVARVSAIGLLRIALLLGLIGLGVLLFHAGLFLALPWTVESKALLALLLGLGYVVVGAVALRAAMDEKTWMEKSGAAEMLEKATDQSKKN